MAITVTGNKAFGDVAVDTTAELSITIANSGAAPQQFTFPASDYFTASPTSVAVDPSGNEAVTIYYTPTENGDHQVAFAGETFTGTGINDTTTESSGTHFMVKVPDYTNGTFEVGDGGVDNVEQNDVVVPAAGGVLLFDRIRPRQGAARSHPARERSLRARCRRLHIYVFGADGVQQERPGVRRRRAHRARRT